ncbi:alpha/beta-hydrolase [Choiromyces venosus 120613-1]|uniref:Carboxylic ester hydrolase n=1 Tax=Choiromyces venosus 120613-1 TaxID=1336337 RepID=A0A3N4JMV2_9PEZI|nr:alpha/beta-hydrolase [Choiromyces venosus 120613-1]
MVRIGFKETFFSLLLIGCGSCATPDNSSLPIVDLGYVKQQATSYNQTYDFFHFRNIRYAAPPLGDLRFRKPQPPLPQTGIQNGDIPLVQSICHQTWPPFLGVGPVGESFGVEDCLYLDVYVPSCVKPGDDVPVLVWVYGGGYIVGIKEILGDPARLIHSADEPMIFVSINYRLGVFGWLSPPNVTDIDANIGLHDGLAAMQWVKEHIPKFGGDEGKITVMGQSAGAGVIIHTITSYGGEGEKLPFQQAILQSAGFDPKRTHYPSRIAQYAELKKATNCTTLKCLRDAPTEVLLKANHDVIMELETGETGAFGPAVDGDYVPDIPMRLLAQGRFHHELKSVFSSNVGFEAGMQFPSPDDVKEGMFDSILNGFYPLAPEALKRKALALYPYQGPGIPEWLRTSALWGDTVFNCNHVWLAKSFQKSFRYVFNLPPATHGQDVAYTFYTGPAPAIANETTAIIHQQYITDYVIRGEPGCEKGACFPKYGRCADALAVNVTEIKVVRDPWATERCDLLKDLAEYS